MSKQRSTQHLVRALLGASLAPGPACTSSSALSPLGKPSAAVVDPSVPQASFATTDDDPNAVPVTSPIHRVTVYSDRALVSREAKVEVSTEPKVYAFKQLPGWVDDGSVRVATTAGRILDVRVGRSYLARATEQSYQKAEARALNDRSLALDDEIAVLDAQSQQIENIRAFSLDKLTEDVHAGAGGSMATAGSVGVTTYAAVVDFIGTKMREIAKARDSVSARIPANLGAGDASRASRGAGPGPPAASPFAPTRKAYDLKDDIEQLEKAF